MSLERSKRLLEEAARDLEIECFDKAASASYFALRRAAEALLEALGEARPRRDDKLANAIENKGLAEIAEALRILYQYRKEADYGEGVSREEAEHGVERARRAVEEIERIMKRTGSL